MKGYSVALAVVLTAKLAVAPAFAQNEQPPGTGNETGQTLQEVVVTAQFRAQDLQTAPLAISVVDAAAMEARGQTNISELANRAPSVGFSPGGQGGGAQTAAVFIRGVGQSDFLLPNEPGVGIYIDDVYYGVSYGAAFDLVDLNRVEILRGPQGTLSGKNSIGGSIKLFSRQPGADNDAYVDATYGSFNRVALKAGANFTLVDGSLYARVTGISRHVDGYLDRLNYTCVTGRPAPGGGFVTGNDCKIGTEGGQDVQAVRAALRWRASARVENNLIADFTDDRSEASPAKALLLPPINGNNYVTGPESYTNYANYTGLPGTPNQFTLPAVSYLRSWGISDAVDAGLTDSLQLKSITAYRYAAAQSAWDGDNSPEDVSTDWNTFSHRQFTQELRLSAQFGHLAEVTVGGYYYNARSRDGGRIDVGVVGLDFASNDLLRQTSKSGFAHLALHPTDRLSIDAGLRYTDESKTYRFGRYSPIPGVPTDFRVVGLDGQQRSFSGSKWDYRVAADYELFDDIRPYAQFATGFKGGGINPRPFFISQALPFGEETVKSYEVGIKTLLLGRRIRLNGDYYHSTYDSFQAQLSSCDSLSPFPGAPCSATQNVGDARIDGFELESELKLSEASSIDASASYTDFRFTRAIAGSGIVPGVTKPTFVSPWKYAVGAQYEFHVGEGSITPRLDWTWQSAMESNAINSVPGYTYGHVDAYGLANARLTYSIHLWQAAFAVTNLTDKFYYLNKFDRVATSGNAYGEPGRPREWRISIDRKF